jgi:hypothetical protein
MSVVATEQIVIELCKETGEPGFQNNATIWGCIFDAIRDLSLHSMPCWSVTQGLTLNSYNALCWPDSCIKPIMTFLTRSVTHDDGTVEKRSFALSVDDNLLGTVNKTNTAGNPDDVLWKFFSSDFFYAVAPYAYQSWNFGLGEIYGLPSDAFKLGVVTHDPSRRQSFVNGCRLESTDTFGIFGKSDGLSSCPEWVPSQAKEAIEYFALAKYYRTRSPQLGAINRENYKQEMYRLSAWEADEGVSAWIDAMRAGTVSSPKG